MMHTFDNEIKMDIKKSKLDHRTGFITSVKFFLVTGMLTLVVGVWSILSRQSREILAVPTQVYNAPNKDEFIQGQALPPIPTLVPLLGVDLNNPGNAGTNFVDKRPTPALRQVPLPVPTTQIDNQPLVVQGSGPITSSSSSR